MSDKVTTMVLKVVDLHCDSCYKKIKKVLCKFPEIRNQVYDEKANKVTITVVCCNPEKMRDKLCCKGGKTIKSIKIIEKPTKPPVVLPGRVCRCQCCEGHYGGPCCQGTGRSLPCCDWCGYWYDYGYCKTKICYESKCDYFIEENTSGCTIM